MCFVSVGQAGGGGAPDIYRNDAGFQKEEVSLRVEALFLPRPVQPTSCTTNQACDCSLPPNIIEPGRVAFMPSYVVLCFVVCMFRHSCHLLIAIHLVCLALTGATIVVFYNLYAVV